MQILLFLLFFAPALLGNGKRYENINVFGIFAVLIVLLFASLRCRGCKPPDLLGKYKILKKINGEIFIASFIVLNILRFSIVYSEGTHQALYLSTPVGLFFNLIRIVAFPGYYFAIVRLIVGKKLIKEKLSLFAIFSILLTGSRGLVIFGVLAIIIFRYGSRKLLRIEGLFIATFGVGLFLLIGYLREPMNMNFISYVYLVAFSISEFSSANLNINNYHINSELVYRQFFDLFTGSISQNRVTYQLTDAINPDALSAGYGISSSMIGEVSLIFPNFVTIGYLAIVFLYGVIFALLISSNIRYFRFIGLSCSPFVLYAVRAELLYPFVFIVKVGFIAGFLFAFESLCGFYIRNQRFNFTNKKECRR